MNVISLFNGSAAKPAPPVNIQNIRVASPCPADWNKMVGDERVRHCDECNLNVYNLSAMTKREIQKLVANNKGRLCGRFYRRADGTMLTQDCPRGLRTVARRVSRIAAAVMTAMMSVSFAVAGTKAQQCPPPANQNEHKEPGVAIVVTDPQGAVVSGAQVALVKQDGKKKMKQKMGTTDSNGRLFLAGLPTGKYELEVSFQGFKTFQHTLQVREDKLESIKLALQLSDSGVMVGVIAEAPMIETSESAVTTTFQGPSLDTGLHSRGGISPIRQ
jgi:5-hydroxyisourate hydrolase-like protein (transthyretin family)